LVKKRAGESLGEYDRCERAIEVNDFAEVVVDRVSNTRETTDVCLYMESSVRG